MGKLLLAMALPALFLGTALAAVQDTSAVAQTDAVEQVESAAQAGFAHADAAAHANAVAQANAFAARCHQYVVINARGDYEHLAPSIAFNGMVQQILGAVPGGIEYQHFPVRPRYGNFLRPGKRHVTTLIRFHDIRNAIQYGLLNCPDQKYVLVGHSHGAAAILRTLRAMKTAAQRDAIKAAVLLRNPLLQAYHQPHHVPFHHRLRHRLLKGLRRLQRHSPFRLPSEWLESGKILNFCHEGEIECRGVPFVPAPVPVAGQVINWAEGPRLQNLGRQFVVPRLQYPGEFPGPFGGFP
ncbi:hypothetical protein HIM_06784 [Hirsutella minnesotensis 3608]|uniref:Fungal lipase-like domain-containing protein n=1 Tax=Hirsutella minnesotensis 3608 TaxID=1043627 RepID=A0A0F7ZIP2_9HYPO|nr:hypothetical protein HIM_06784 [Hirsutella minnesotensis 3608]